MKLNSLATCDMLALERRGWSKFYVTFDELMMFFWVHAAKRDLEKYEPGSVCVFTVKYNSNIQQAFGVPMA